MGARVRDDPALPVLVRRILDRVATGQRCDDPPVLAADSVAAHRCARARQHGGRLDDRERGRSIELALAGTGMGGEPAAGLLDLEPTGLARSVPGDPGIAART